MNTLIRKSLWGNGVWTHVNSKGKIPSTGKFPQRKIEPTTLWTASLDTTNELFRPPDCISLELRLSVWSLLLLLFFLFHRCAMVAWESHIPTLKHLSMSSQDLQYVFVFVSGGCCGGVVIWGYCLHYVKEGHYLCLCVHAHARKTDLSWTGDDRGIESGRKPFCLSFFSCSLFFC